MFSSVRGFFVGRIKGVEGVKGGHSCAYGRVYFRRSLALFSSFASAVLMFIDKLIAFTVLPQRLSGHSKLLRLEALRTERGEGHMHLKPFCLGLIKRPL